MKRHLRFVIVVATALALPARDGRAESAPPAPSPWYVEAHAGPAFATFFPIDGGGISEHLATAGTQIAAGAGRGFDLGRVRLDLGLRVQYLRLQVQGSYSLTEVNDSYHANYDYLAGLLEVGLASQRRERVNAFVTATVGTARLFSNRQGEPLRNHQLAIYGSFEAGLLIRMAEDIDAQLGLSWIPPVSNITVVTPFLGVRALL